MITNSCHTPVIFSHKPVSILSGNISYLAQTTYSRQLLPFFLSRWGTKHEQSNMGIQGSRLHIYILQLHIWLIFCFIDSGDEWWKIRNIMWRHIAVKVIHISFLQLYMSLIFYFIDRFDYTRTMSSEIWIHMAETSYKFIFIITYVNDILFLLEFVYYPLPSKMVRCWNPFHDSLMESSHIQTWILIWFKFPISKTECRILLWIQATIDVKPQYKFYEVQTLEFTISCLELHILLNTANLQNTYLYKTIYI